jgi:RNA binding exosome subunit
MVLDMSTNDPIQKLKIRQIDIRTNAHATESIDMVKNKIKSIISVALTEKNCEINHCSGQYGQRISSITVHLKTQARIKEMIGIIAQFLHENDKKYMNRTFHLRLDRKFKFHFRIDKHRNISKAEILSSSPDTIQIVIMVQNKTPTFPLTIENLKEYYKELNLII